jgi:type IV pilus assembly protein PilA
MMKKSKGFTLVELMIVVVIIGVIAALAIPRFMNTSTKTKQSEAQGILKQIYTMELTHFEQYNAYTDDIDELDVEFMANTRYDYSVQVDGTAFIAIAVSPDPGLDDDPSPDVWTVDETGVIVCVTNDVIE